MDIIYEFTGYRPVFLIEANRSDQMLKKNLILGAGGSMI